MWSFIANATKVVVAAGSVAAVAVSAFSSAKNAIDNAPAVISELQRTLAAEADSNLSMLAALDALPDRTAASLVELTVALKAKLQSLCDMNDIFSKLKQCGDHPDSLGMWEEAKVRGLTRVVLSAYCVPLLAAVVQVQLTLCTRFCAGSGETMEGAVAETMTPDEKAAHIEALRVITHNFIEVGVPRLCALVRAAVVAMTTEELRVFVQPEGQSSAPASPSAVGGGSPTSRSTDPSASLKATNISAAELWSLTQRIRATIEMPALRDFSDTTLLSERMRTKYEPFRPLLSLLQGDGGHKLSETSAVAATLAWGPDLLVRCTLDALTSPGFQAIAKASVDEMFAALCNDMYATVFKQASGRRNDSETTPLRSATTRFRPWSDRLFADGAVNTISRMKDLQDFCRMLVMDAKM